MDASTARWLASADAAAPIAVAHEAVRGRDALAAATWLRTQAPALPPTRAAAVLEQATLSALAADRYGLTAASLLLTRDGLEQATRPEVAARRATSFAAAGAHRVVDLTAGLGFDVRAFLDAGLEVVAVERDEATAALLAANAPGAAVVVGDGTEVLPSLLADLAPTDVVFVDPARRDPAGARDRATGRARPERDPVRWSPPWPWVEQVGHPRVVAKVAPAFEPPDGWQGQWTSWRRDVVEAQVASWPMTSAIRRAVVLGPGTEAVVAADPGVTLTYLDAGETPAILVEPDPAVLRAGAVSRLAADLGLRGLDRASSWLVGDDDGSATSSLALRGFRVLRELAGTPRERRRTLRELGIDRLVVKTADVAVSPESVRRDLGMADGGDHVLVLTRRAGRTVAYVATPVARG